MLPGFRVAGRVVNGVSGAAVERARLTLADARVPSRRMETMSGEGGEFSFADVPAGRYILQGSRAGFQETAYEQHEEFSTAIVTSAETQTEELVLRLAPLATITGYVLDETGEGVRKARVTLYRESNSEGAADVSMESDALSDDRGYFDFNLLRTGKYFVSVEGKPWYAVHPQLLGPGKKEATPKVPAALDVVYPLTFYGGETEAESAEPVFLKAGETQEISIRLAPVPSLHLLLHGQTNARMPGGGDVMPPTLHRQVFGAAVEVFPEMLPVSPGTVELTGLAAGRYDVVLPLGMRGTQSLGEVNLEQNGQVVNGARGEATGTLHVTLRLRGGTALPEKYEVELVDARMKVAARGWGGGKRAATIEELKTGWYGIEVKAEGRKFSVVRTSAAAGESAGNRVNVAPGTTDVTADVVEGSSEVEGVAERDGKAAAGVMVVLAPKEEGHPELYRRAQSGLDGRFAIEGVVPGMYTVIAEEEGWGVEWKETGKGAGKNVTVGEKVVEVGVVDVEK